VKNFLGTPIYKRVLNEVEKFGFDKIIVSTDSEEILSECKYAKKRNPANATDSATLTDVVVEYLYNAENDPDYICLILPTAVFATAEDIAKGGSMIEHCDCVATFCKYPHPIERTFISKWGYMEMRNTKHAFTQTQGIRESYYDAGQFYWINVKSFRKQGKIFMDKTAPIIVEAVDIDTPEDWIKAEALYGAR